MMLSERNWVVWARWDRKWFSLPWTARTTRALSILAWQDGRMEGRNQWERMRRAGDVRCIRTTFTAVAP